MSDFELALMRKVEAVLALVSETENRPLGLVEAAKYLGVSRGYLYKLTCGSRIPFYKPTGKRLYFRKSELDAWVYARRSATVEELKRDV